MPIYIEKQSHQKPWVSIALSAGLLIFACYALARGIRLWQRIGRLPQGEIGLGIAALIIGSGLAVFAYYAWRGRPAAQLEVDPGKQVIRRSGTDQTGPWTRTIAFGQVTRIDWRDLQRAIRYQTVEGARFNRFWVHEVVAQPEGIVLYRASSRNHAAAVAREIAGAVGCTCGSFVGSKYEEEGFVSEVELEALRRLEESPHEPQA